MSSSATLARYAKKSIRNEIAELNTPISSGVGTYRTSTGIINSRTSYQELDRPAHWSSASALKPMNTIAKQKRPHSTTQVKTVGSSTSISSGPATFSTMKRRHFESKTPQSLDGISFAPSWMKKRVSISLSDLKNSRPINIQKDAIENDFVEDDSTTFVMRAAPGFQDDIDIDNSCYDRIEDLSNSVYPTHEFSLSNAVHNESLYYGDKFDKTVSELSPGQFPPIRSDYYESPVKSAKRKLKHYGAMLKRVIRISEGTEARWINLDQMHLINQNKDPIRFDLSDPRCTSNRCIDITVLAHRNDQQLKKNYGLEILLVKIDQFCERLDKSTTFNRLSPHQVKAMLSGAVSVKKDFARKDSTDLLGKSVEVIVKPSEMILGLFRSSTLQFLQAANGQPLINSTLRIYDYMLMPDLLKNCLREDDYGVEDIDRNNVRSMICLVCTSVAEIRKATTTV